MQIALRPILPFVLFASKFIGAFLGVLLLVLMTTILIVAATSLPRAILSLLAATGFFIAAFGLRRLKVTVDFDDPCPAGDYLKGTILTGVGLLLVIPQAVVLLVA